MKCEECGGQVAIDRDGVRRYDLGGLPHVELHGIEVLRCRHCGHEGVAIPRMAQLHRMLADRFVRQQRMLAPVEIRFLRKHVGLSGTQLAQRMGVTRETVSRWETGAVPMGSVADRLLRLLVVAQEPAESCAVDEMLSGLTDAPAPLKLPSVALWVNGRSGWSAGNARVLSKR